MEGEDKKVGLKKRFKGVVEINLDSDDDEPIGSLFKLKSKKNPKKVKLGSDGERGKEVGAKGEIVEVNMEELGGMEDTLASFRKKLKGPKKDGGLGSLVKKDLVSKLVEMPDGCLKGSQKDEDLATKSVQDYENGLGDVSSVSNSSRKLEKKRKVKVKSKIASAEKNLGVIVEVEDAEMLDVNSSENQVKRQEHLLVPENKHKKGSRSKSSSAAMSQKVAVETDDSVLPSDHALGDQPEGNKDLSTSPSHDILTDSLSSLLRKAQSSGRKKSRATSGLKSRRGHTPENSLSDANLSINSQKLDQVSCSGQISFVPSCCELAGDQGLDTPCGEKLITEKSTRQSDVTYGDTCNSMLDHSSPVSPFVACL
ncbi:unnamed protein product, partial [Amaranthus hypochondriacus]